MADQFGSIAALQICLVFLHFIEEVGGEIEEEVVGEIEVVEKVEILRRVGGEKKKSNKHKSKHKAHIRLKVQLFYKKS